MKNLTQDEISIKLAEKMGECVPYVDIPEMEVRIINPKHKYFNYKADVCSIDGDRIHLRVLELIFSPATSYSPPERAWTIVDGVDVFVNDIELWKPIPRGYDLNLLVDAAVELDVNYLTNKTTEAICYQVETVWGIKRVKAYYKEYPTPHDAACVALGTAIIEACKKRKILSTRDGIIEEFLTPFIKENDKE